jgi:hypothetical protein
MRHSKLVASGLLAFAFACAAKANYTDPLADETARAQGTIVLGASHSPGSSNVAPSVAVSFVPDTTATMTSCGQTAFGDTCIVTQAPDCSTLGCKAGETCGWDDSCNASCIAACTLSCGANQQCSMAGDGSMSCVAIQTFDAGPIAISGTNMPIAVYPPYAWKTSDDGSPFAPGASLRVQAAGPTGAGFASFDVSFNATTLLEANPPLDQLNIDDVFGSGDVALGWLPGNDRVYVLASGAGGSAKCLADDTTGSFTLTRDVISAVLGTTADANALSLSIQRWRLERHQDAKTTGSLDAQTIQPKAWLDLITTSTESIALQACKTNETSCGSKCVSTDTDPDNCGGCGNSCNGKACVNGSCTTSTTGSCSSCETTANSGTCASSYEECTGDCQSLFSCVGACAGDTTCMSDCYSEYPNGQSAFESYYECICTSACSSQCATQCGQ